MDIKLILIAENRIYREGIGHFLEQIQGFDLLSAHCSCAIAKQTLAKCKVDIVVVDGHLSDAMDMRHAFKHDQSDLKVVMLTHGNDTDMVSNCMLAGVEGVVTNNESIQDLRQCILSVHSRHLCYPANSCALLQQSAQQSTYAPNSVFTLDLKPETRLTFRQVKVMRLVEQGYSNKEIARKLNIELCTVKNHVHHILDKLRVKNRCEAASLFRKGVGQQA
ncbi:MAG: two-component system nitrate/nitrite response regulator NarL [Patiriisocius sp.]|jgi:DNA-binding NarL/FixJ family response regulator